MYLFLSIHHFMSLFRPRIPIIHFIYLDLGISSSDIQSHYTLVIGSFNHILLYSFHHHLYIHSLIICISIHVILNTYNIIYKSTHICTSSTYIIKPCYHYHTHHLSITTYIIIDPSCITTCQSHIDHIIKHHACQKYLKHPSCIHKCQSHHKHDTSYQIIKSSCIIIIHIIIQIHHQVHQCSYT